AGSSARGSERSAWSQTTPGSARFTRSLRNTARVGTPAAASSRISSVPMVPVLPVTVTTIVFFLLLHPGPASAAVATGANLEGFADHWTTSSAIAQAEAPDDRRDCADGLGDIYSIPIPQQR